MLVYLGVYAAISLAALSISERSGKTFALIVGLFLIWFMGARYYVGCDWTGYLRRFTFTPVDLSIREFLLNFDEPGFWFLTVFVKSSELSYMWLNIFASILMVVCFVVFARAHRDSLLILALLFPVVIVQLGMSGIRQGIAVGFLMLASIAWMRGSMIWTAVWIIVGAQFHVSLVVFLPMVWLAGKKLSSVKLVASVLVLGPLAVFLLGGRADTYTERYLESDITSGGALIRYALILIPALLFLNHWKSLRAKFPESFELMKLSTVLSFSLIPVAIFSSILLHRMNYYVMPLSIITFAGLSRVAFPSTSRTLVRSMPVLVYSGYSAFWFLTSRHADRCYIPYDNYWGLGLF